MAPAAEAAGQDNGEQTTADEGSLANSPAGAAVASDDTAKRVVKHLDDDNNHDNEKHENDDEASDRTRSLSSEEEEDGISKTTSSTTNNSSTEQEHELPQTAAYEEEQEDQHLPATTILRTVVSLLHNETIFRGSSTTNNNRIQNESLLVQQQQRQQLQHLFDTQDWKALQKFFYKYPEWAYRQHAVEITCHGERTTVYPLHAAVACKHPSLQLLQLLVTISPCSIQKVNTATTSASAASEQQQQQQCLLPLHLALLKHVQSIAVIQYLCRLYPAALQHADRDGNLPLHYAAQYTQDSAIFEFVWKQYPAAACRVIANEQQRTVLHLLCMRDGGWWNSTTAIDMKLLQTIGEEYPQAVTHCDRYGRLPLHWACAQHEPRWDVVAWLIDQYPAGLLVQDQSSALPVQLAQRLCSSSNNSNNNNSHQESPSVVLAFLQDRTAAEQRRLQQPQRRLLFGKFRRRKQQADVDEKTMTLLKGYCYG